MTHILKNIFIVLMMICLITSVSATDICTAVNTIGQMNQTPNMTAGQQGLQGDPGTPGNPGSNGLNNMTMNLTPNLTVIDTSNFLFRNGTRGMLANFSMGNFNISRLLDPIAAQDAATKNYVDSVNLSMMNNVSQYVIAVNTSMQAYVDAKPSGGSGDTSQFVFLNGTRNMTGDLAMGGFNISDVLNPVALQDAATKHYVDDVNASMGNNVSIYVIAVNNSMRNNVSQYVIAVNNSNMNNMSQYVILVNNTMRNNVSQYVIAVNNSMRNNITANFAPIVAGKVPIANLGTSGSPDGTVYLRGDNTWATPIGVMNTTPNMTPNMTQGAPGVSNYALSVMGLSTTISKVASNYFGNQPKAAPIVAENNKIYIPKTGTIKRVDLVFNTTTTGTSETWAMYVKNSTSITDATNLIANVAVANPERLWSNSTLNIPVTAGGYVEIRSLTVQGTVAIGTLGGNIYIE